MQVQRREDVERRQKDARLARKAKLAAVDDDLVDKAKIATASTTSPGGNTSATGARKRASGKGSHPA